METKITSTFFTSNRSSGKGSCKRHLTVSCCTTKQQSEQNINEWSWEEACGKNSSWRKPRTEPQTAQRNLPTCFCSLDGFKPLHPKHSRLWITATVSCISKKKKHPTCYSSNIKKSNTTHFHWLVLIDKSLWQEVLTKEAIEFGDSLSTIKDIMTNK